MKRWSRPLTALCLAVLVTAPQAAQATVRKAEKLLGTFGVWHAYTYDEGGQTVCYMVTTKIITSSGLKKRAIPYLMITHRPVEASTDVFSYGAGTLLNARRGIKLQVGTSSFDLFSVSDTAWSRDGITDHKIASALRREATAHMTAFPSQKGGRRIVDVFDLKGASSAYLAIGRACGLSHKISHPKVTTPVGQIKKRS